MNKSICLNEKYYFHTPHVNRGNLQMAVDLGGLAVLGQQTTKNAHAAHPDHAGRKAGLFGTTALTSALISPAINKCYKLKGFYCIN